uniref:AlNc14C90G5647 protein n=1 Tax=Albugo laibachii Nc14 TaxID=890382 RepID=F0WGB6_9STRA|nr:AlNc14C90G5647 [Albugo laibachii Nc14]|eukprot:CCA20276.1 AlNc14C90G5647 [Albugo laibachii Nc14]
MVNGHSSPFFQLGSGVRQGDPLSPSLFVLFLQPMLNYLRATMGHLGILIVQDPTPPIISPRSPMMSPVYYAILRTPQNFCGMFDTTLSPWDFSSIRPRLKCFAFTRRNRFASLGSSNTLHHLPRGGSPPFLRPSNPALPCDDFVLVHTAAGPVLLRSTALPLLWYPAAVTPIPAAVLISVWHLCKAFLFQQPLDPAQACRGPMAQDWLTRPPSQGGLGLPCPTSFSRAMHLCTLRDGLRSCSSLRASCWFLPALELMSLALHDTGAGLDIFYSPIHQSTVPQPQWGVLGSFWYSTLQQWYRLLHSSHNTTTRTQDWLQAPHWQNYRRVCGRANRPLLYISKHCNFLYQHGLRTLFDFLTRHGELPHSHVLKSILSSTLFHRPRGHTATANVIARTFNDLGLLTGPIPLGPFLPQYIAATFHPWSFKAVPFAKYTNAGLYKPLHVIPSKALPPDKALDTIAPTDWTQMWKRDRSLDRDSYPSIPISSSAYNITVIGSVRSTAIIPRQSHASSRAQRWNRPGTCFGTVR